MPAFDTQQGFLLLLLLPALWLIRRKQSRLRTLPVSILPILKDLFDRRTSQPPKIFRLKRKQRALLYSVALVCAIFAFNGFHLKMDRKVPDKWILVLDNPFVLNLRVEDKTLTRWISDGAQRLLKKIPSQDSVALMVTSPKPTFLTHLSRRGTIGKVTKLEPSLSALPVRSLAKLVVGAASDPEVNGAVVLSPRAASWREVLAESQGSDVVLVPADRESATGNAGIVAFDIRPSREEEGRYDLFLRTLSHRIDSPVLSAVLTAPSNQAEIIGIEVDDKGLGRYFSRNIELSPGEVSISLNVEDHFPDDNTVRAFVPENRKIQLRLINEPHPFLKEAILSYDGYTIADETLRSDLPAVDIFIGSAPGERVERPTLIIRPQDDFLNFQFSRFIERPTEARFHPTHPATRNASFRNFRPTRTIDFHQPPGFETLARAERTPLIMAGEHGGHRVMVWTFDPLGAGIFLEPSFIILLRDSLGWLSESIEGERSERFLNILDPLITKQAGSVSLPDIDGIDLPSKGDTVPGRFPLAPWFLILAFGILAYLTVVETYLSGGSP